jgi:GLPGLI family protein
MNKISLSSILFLMCLQLCAQDFQGIVVYQSKIKLTKLFDSPQVPDEMKKIIEERMKRNSEKTFIMHFDKTSSIYEQQKKIDLPIAGMGGMRLMPNAADDDGKLYKNIKENIIIEERDFMGKEFLIKDSLPKLIWKLENETKQIGDYTCFKASVIKKSISNVRDKDREKIRKAKKTNFMDDFELPKEITVTAWYTPEIPVNQGPENYWGLPGLILEVNDGKTTVLCSKIVLNAKEKAEIKAPTNGKVISQKEYDETVVKKMEELRQMNQGHGGNGGMRIGG